MCRRVAALALALCLCLGGGPRALAAASAYYIRVNCATCTVTVYATDGAGRRGEPVKAMVCSVGKPGKGVTPKGVFALTGYRREWNRMRDGSYGQYVSQFRGNYLFHSACYRKADPGTLIAQEYNDLGSPASLGCVRLQAADAKWIFDHCPAGTKVEIFEGGAEDDPLGKPEKRLAYLDPDDPNSGWDPTDPREENPWHALLRARTTHLSTQGVEVDGQAVEFGCCALKDEQGYDVNYIRLRDLAMLLRHTAARFQVGYYDMVNIATGWDYTPQGDEGTAPVRGEQTCRPERQRINVDGTVLELEGLTLTDDTGGGHTYYKLRDLGRALGFEVGWSAQEGIYIHTCVETQEQGG